MVEETDYGGCWHKVSFSYGQHLHKHENKIFNHYNITRKQDFLYHIYYTKTRFLIIQS